MAIWQNGKFTGVRPILSGFKHTVKSIKMVLKPGEIGLKKGIIFRWLIIPLPKARSLKFGSLTICWGKVV